jgi:predicted RNase H-like nuclease (RuvC/YqgF family)
MSVSPSPQTSARAKIAEEISRLKKEIETEKSKSARLETEISRMRADYESQITALKSQRSNAEDKEVIQELTAELEARESEVASLKAKLSANPTVNDDNEIEDLRDQVEELSEENDRLRQEAQRCKVLEQSEVKLKRQIGILEQENAAKMELIEDMENETRELRRSLEEQIRELKAEQRPSAPVVAAVSSTEIEKLRSQNASLLAERE